MNMKLPFTYFTGGLLAVLCCLLTGCSYFEKPVFCLSIHKVTSKKSYAPESLLVRSVGDVNGNSLADVSQFPVVDSSSFGDVQLVRGDKDKWGLRLKMDKKGTNLWREATAQYHGMQMAILLDGFFVGTMTVPAYDESGYLMLPPLWSEDEAREIASHVSSNYDLIND